MTQHTKEFPRLRTTTTVAGKKPTTKFTLPPLIGRPKMASVYLRQPVSLACPVLLRLCLLTFEFLKKLVDD
jgi:hypothetical protein